MPTTLEIKPAVKLARRDRLVLENLGLVKAIAMRVRGRLPLHVDLEDLVHAGILGLFDAASKYDPGKQVVFSSYAKHRIKGAILDSLRQLDWASRDMRRRYKQVEGRDQRSDHDPSTDAYRCRDRGQTRAEFGPVDGREIGTAGGRINLGIHSSRGGRRSAFARISEWTRNPARFHVRAPANAKRPGPRDEGPARPVSEGSVPLLHKRDDDARNRRHTRH
jgi:RNA polymerase sigma factor (sigma-70 family)